MLKKTLVVFCVVLILVPAIAIGASAQETVRTYLSADNELLYKSHSDIQGIGTPDHFLLSLDRGTWEDKYPYQAWCTYRNKYTANTSDGWSDSTFISPLPNFTTENYRIDVKDVLNRGFSEDCYQFRLGIQTKNSTNSEPGFQDTFPYLMTGKACSFSVEFYSSWGFAAVKSAKFVVRMYYVDPLTQNVSYVYFYTANYNVSQYSDTQTLAATFTIFNKTGRTLNLAGVYIDFEAGANSWKNFSGNYGFGRLKYHQFTDDEWLAYQDDISRRAQTDALLNVGVEMQENEKEESNSQGNASVDALESVIPNDSDGFVNGMSSLISAMSYNGTEAKWKLPALYIPAIPGVINKTQLTDSELDIDFGYWVQQIPSDVLEIIQIVLTIALVIYCFKELYGTISYVLTLKKDGGGE